MISIKRNEFAPTITITSDEMKRGLEATTKPQRRPAQPGVARTRAQENDDDVPK